MTTPEAIAVGAVFGQVALTLWAIYSMGAARLTVLKTREVLFADIALETTAYPPRVRQMQNNTRNQFETPILLYTGVLLALTLQIVNWGVAGFGLAFFLTRLGHRYVHVGSNHLPTRFKIYTLGLLMLVGLWFAIFVGLVV